jgi:hypothetical protein
LNVSPPVRILDLFPGAGSYKSKIRVDFGEVRRLRAVRAFLRDAGRVRRSAAALLAATARSASAFSAAEMGRVADRACRMTVRADSRFRAAGLRATRLFAGVILTGALAGFLDTVLDTVLVLETVRAGGLAAGRFAAVRRLAAGFLAGAAGLVLTALTVLTAFTGRVLAAGLLAGAAFFLRRAAAALA